MDFSLQCYCQANRSAVATGNLFVVPLPHPRDHVDRLLPWWHCRSTHIVSVSFLILLVKTRRDVQLFNAWYVGGDMFDEQMCSKMLTVLLSNIKGKKESGQVQVFRVQVHSLVLRHVGRYTRISSTSGCILTRRDYPVFADVQRSTPLIRISGGNIFTLLSGGGSAVRRWPIDQRLWVWIPFMAEFNFYLTVALLVYSAYFSNECWLLSPGSSKIEPGRQIRIYVFCWLSDDKSVYRSVFVSSILGGRTENVLWMLCVYSLLLFVSSLNAFIS